VNALDEGAGTTDRALRPDEVRQMWRTRPDSDLELRSAGAGSTRLAARSFTEHRLALAGLIIILLMLLFCFVGPIFYHTNQLVTNLNNPITQAPSHAHLLGTDPNGFDELGRLMFGGQSSLEVGITAAIVATAIGVAVGSVAGFFGGIVDALLMRVVDTLLAIPLLLLLIVLSVQFRPGKYAMILVIGLVAWLVPARLVRGETLTLRTREYVQAVRVMGGGSRKIILRHIIPNAIGTIAVNATFQVADAILLLAALGYLGVGIQPPQTDWGSMLSVGAAYVESGAWWLIWPPAFCIVLVVVAFNFVGDGLRDALEVRLQRR
jgi:peptide/nickel transport system permease protein